MFMRIVLTACAVAALSLGSASAQEQKAPAGNAARGKQLYMADGCFQCHGTVGQGSRVTGPRLARTQLPFIGFVSELRNPSNEMPPYEAKVLSDAEATNIYAYLESLPAPPAVKDVPLLNQ